MASLIVGGQRERVGLDTANAGFGGSRKSACNFGSGSVGTVYRSSNGLTALACQVQAARDFAIELAAERDQVANAVRGLAADHLGGRLVDQSVAGRNRVLEVQFPGIFNGHCGCHTTLSERSRTLADGPFVNDHNVGSIGQGASGEQTGNPGSDDADVGFDLGGHGWSLSGMVAGPVYSRRRMSDNDRVKRIAIVVAASLVLIGAVASVARSRSDGVPSPEPSPSPTPSYVIYEPPSPQPSPNVVPISTEVPEAPPSEEPDEQSDAKGDDAEEAPDDPGCGSSQGLENAIAKHAEKLAEKPDSKGLKNSLEHLKANLAKHAAKVCVGEASDSEEPSGKEPGEDDEVQDEQGEDDQGEDDQGEDDQGEDEQD